MMLFTKCRKEDEEVLTRSRHTQRERVNHPGTRAKRGRSQGRVRDGWEMSALREAKHRAKIPATVLIFPLNSRA